MNHSVIMIGLAKTGTTGQYNLVKRALKSEHSNVLSVFEPTRRITMRNLSVNARKGVPVVTKVMMAREKELLTPYENFAKRIMIVRDPRDMVISFLLFRPMLFSKSLTEFERKDRFSKLLDRLQQRVNGGNESVLSLHNYASSLGAGNVSWHKIADLMERQVSLLNEFDFFVSSYESFVAKEHADLWNYLELCDNPKSEEPNDSGGEWLSHITRSKSSGDWKSWFTEEDVSFFRPLFSRYMYRMGYVDDWNRSDRAAIDPETTIDYLNKKFNKLGGQMDHLRESIQTGEISAEALPLIRERADDGDAACVRLLVDYYHSLGSDMVDEHKFWLLRAEMLGVYN